MLKGSMERAAWRALVGLLVVALGLSLGAMALAGGGEAHVLVFKPGDAAATSDKAGPVLRKLEGYLAASVPAFAGKAVKAHITNNPDEAVRVFKDRQPALVIAPPSFVFSQLPADAAPVAHIPRFGAKGDRLYLVTARKGGASDAAGLAGKDVATASGLDPRYLTRVGKLPADLKLAPAPNLADVLFEMTEGGGGPAAVLLDEELKHFFEKDDLIWPSLQIAWTSAPLPWTPVVAVGKWADADRAALLKALQGMGADPAGAEVLKLLSSKGIEPVERAPLDAARKSYGR